MDSRRQSVPCIGDMVLSIGKPKTFKYGKKKKKKQSENSICNISSLLLCRWQKHWGRNGITSPFVTAWKIPENKRKWEDVMMKTIKIPKKEIPQFPMIHSLNSVSILLKHTHLKIQSWHLHKNMQCRAFYIWATSLRIIVFSSVPSFSLQSLIIFYGIYVLHFHYPSSVDEHLSYFLFLFLVDRVSVSMEEQVSLE